MGPTPLQERASELAEQNEFQAARPYLLEIISRFSGGTEEEQASLGPVYFFTGLSYLQEFSQAPDEALLRSAVEAFTNAIAAGVTEEREISILEFRGDAYRGLGEYQNAVADYEKVLSPPLVRRLRPDDERELLQKISVSLQALRQWERALPWFQRFLEISVTDEQRALAAGLILEAYIEEENVDGILELLPLITVDSPSRYSVSLNVALMEAGDKLADNGRYAQAALLYNAALTREQILQYFEERAAAQEARLEAMRASGRSDDRLADEIIALRTTNDQLEAVRQVTPYSSQLMARVARNYYLAQRDYEAVWAYLRFLENYPDDPIAEEFQFAAFITATKIGMESLSQRLGEEILEGRGASEDFRKKVLLSLASVYMESGDDRSFFQTVDDYLQQFPNSPEAAQMVFLLGSKLLNSGNFDELEDRFASLQKDLAGTPAEDGLFYWPGLAFLFQGEYEEAREEFTVISEKFPDSEYGEDAAYRIAMTYYGADEIDRAVQEFRDFIQKYPNGELRGEAEFFLGEIAASEGKLLEAIRYYDEVPAHTENMSFITMAFFQKAKLLERNGAIERAIEAYEEYIDRFGEDGALTQAIFLLGEIQKEQGRPGEALNQFRDVILKYGDDPENLGVDPMIGTYVEQYDEIKNRLTGTLEFLEKIESDPEYRTSIATNRGFLYEQFADNPSLDPVLYEELRRSQEFSEALAASVDPILPYLNRYREQLATFPEETPETVFSREFEDAKQSGERTLAMRLQMALEELGSPPRNPLVLQESDLELASPKVLVWIGNRQRRVNPDLAKDAYRAAINHEELVAEQVEAYLNLGDMLMAQGDTTGAMQLYGQAEENFPADPRIYRALIAQAKVFAEQGNTEESRDRLMQILKTPDWRGEPHAEALYRVGLTYFEEGQYPEAHGFFERTFLGYGLFDEWAAKAYLMDAKTLVEMGEQEDAERTLAEALEDERYRETEVYSELVEYANSL